MTDDFINVSHNYWGSSRPTSVYGYVDHGRALPTIRIIVPSPRMVSVRPTTIAQLISEQYMDVLHSPTERDTIFLYLIMRIHRVLHEIHFKATQIRPGFHIYVLERSFCLIVNIINNIRHTSRCEIRLCSHSGLC